MCRLKTCTHVKATSRMPAGSGRRLLTCGIHSQVRQPEVDLANNANQIVSVVRPIDQCLEFLLCVRHPKKPDGSSRVEAAQDFIEHAAGADAPSPLYFFGQQRRIKAAGGSPCAAPSGRKNPITLPSPSQSSTACVASPSRRHVSWSSVNRTTKGSPAEVAVTFFTRYSPPAASAMSPSRPRSRHRSHSSRISAMSTSGFRDRSSTMSARDFMPPA
jgi:hypothetical protein